MIPNHKNYAFKRKYAGTHLQLPHALNHGSASNRHPQHEFFLLVTVRIKQIQVLWQK